MKRLQHRVAFCPQVSQSVEIAPRVHVGTAVQPRGLEVIRLWQALRSLLSCLAVWPLLLGTLACAQQTASVQGRVTDPTGAAIVGATVELQQTETHSSQRATTDRSGLYVFLTVKPGTYDLTCSAEGFSSNLLTRLPVDVGAKVSRDVTLTTGSVNETVTVNGNGQEINTVDAGVSTVINREMVENIPLNGRSFQSLLTLAPGVSEVPSYRGANYSGSFTVNGQRTESNYFIVDGVSINIGAGPASASDPGRGSGFAGLTPGLTALGTTQSITSIDALEEFRTSTSTYSAEYGHTAGGQFSFNTRSGTNALHGTLYEYLRNGATSGNDWFNNYYGIPRIPEKLNDFGGTLGGPVVLPKLYNGRNRTFFFASYEGLRLRIPTPAFPTSPPSVYLRQHAAPELRPILNSFPIPNGPDLLSPQDPTQPVGPNNPLVPNGTAQFTAAYSSPSTLDAFSLRGDQTIGDKLRLFARYTYSPSESVSRYDSDLARLIHVQQNFQTITAGATYTISNRMVNDLRYNFSQVVAKRFDILDNFGGATPLQIDGIPGFRNDETNNFYFYAPIGDLFQYVLQPRTVKQHQQNIVDTFNWALGRHTLRFGVDYRHIYDYQRLPEVFETVGYSNQSELLNGTNDGISTVAYQSPINAVYQYFSAFGQDEWKATNRLSLSLGLRWDLAPPPGDSAGNLPRTFTSADLSTLNLAPHGTPLWQTDHTGFAPRLGAAYVLRSDPQTQTVLRAGYGVYVDTANAYASVGYAGAGVAYSYNLSGSTSFPLPANVIAGYRTARPPIDFPYTGYAAGAVPNLRLPKSQEFNVAVEQALGKKQTLTFTYLGAVANNLLTVKDFYPYAAGNPNFADGTQVALVQNLASSNYNSLQVRFQRQLSSGLQALLSYSYAHAIDNATSNYDISELLRGNSDNDIRHNFQAAITYAVPSFTLNKVATALLQHWGIDTRIYMQSATPVDIFGETTVDARGQSVSYQPNVVPNQPLYVYGSQFPGGKAFNFDAFVTAQNDTEGNFPRNKLRGNNLVQVDAGMKRSFQLYEALHLEARVEAFNLFNHPNFNFYNQYLSAGPGQGGFGQATGTFAQAQFLGTARSLQASLRLRF